MARTKTKQPRFKSGLESKIWKDLPRGVRYETDKLTYTVDHTYTPDFVIRPNVYIEAKGRFLSSDRAKHLYIKEQHPEVTVYFLFGNAENTLTRSSKTTYRMWCEKHGFKCADYYREGIPKEWFKE